MLQRLRQKSLLSNLILCECVFKSQAHFKTIRGNNILLHRVREGKKKSNEKMATAVVVDQNHFGHPELMCCYCWHRFLPDPLWVSEWLWGPTSHTVCLFIKKTRQTGSSIVKRKNSRHESATPLVGRCQCVCIPSLHTAPSQSLPSFSFLFTYVISFYIFFVFFYLLRRSFVLFGRCKFQHRSDIRGGR